MLLTAAGFALYGLNWLVMRLSFRLRVSGLEHVPAGGAYAIAPNHLSDLDGLVIAAATPISSKNTSNASAVLRRSQIFMSFMV